MGSALNRWQAIILTMMVYFTDAYVRQSNSASMGQEYFLE